MIISHNPITTYQNMGKTMLALFDQFDSAELCQLYIYPSVPNVKKCNSYFRMTDKDIFRSYYRLHIDCGEVGVDINCQSMFTNEQDEKIYNKHKSNNSFRKIVRDLMWKCSHWYNESLKNWIEKEKPDCIFLAPGDAKFIYDIALKISKKHNLPIITYICDDYYFVKESRHLLVKLQQKLLHKKIKKILTNTSHIITICDELCECYSRKFGKASSTIMTGTNYPIAKKPLLCDKPNSITYMGNVRCNRYKSIMAIGRELDELNLQNKTSYSLKVYTSANDSEIISSFEKIKSISFCGHVSGDEFDKIFHSSDFLLHTEGFDEDSIDRVKHSVSTKIADSLGSGIPLIAYGPESVSSMKYLIRNDCAIVIKKEDELRDMLLRAFENFDMRERVTKKALKVASENHVSEINSKKLYEIVEKVVFDKV